MDFKEISNIKHFLFDSVEEFSIHYPNIEVTGNWRSGKEGDWVFTDDMHVCQILKKSRIYEKVDQKYKDYVRTVCGSFVIQKKCHKMYGEYGIAENIYAFSRNYKSHRVYQKDNKLKNKEFLFARYIARDQCQAHLTCVSSMCFCQVALPGMFAITFANDLCHARLPGCFSIELAMGVWQ